MQQESLILQILMILDSGRLSQLVGAVHVVAFLKFSQHLKPLRAWDTFPGSINHLQNTLMEVGLESSMSKTNPVRSQWDS